VNLRYVAAAIVAVGLIFLGAALLQPSPDEPVNPIGLTDRFLVRAEMADGTAARATATCEGTVHGTGYLSDPAASARACTFDNTVSVHRFLLKGRSACPLLVADAAALPERTAVGTATITGIYFDTHIDRRIDAVGGSACDRAAWKLLGPLLPQ
jgi:hypothetical protein